MPPDVNSFVGRGAGRCCSTKASVYDAHFFQGIIFYSYEYKAYIHVCIYNTGPRLSPAVVLYIQTVEAGSQRRKVRTAWISGRPISQLINGRGETPSNKRRNKNKNKNSDMFSLGVCGSKVFTRTSGLGGKDEALGGVGLVSLMRRHMHNCVYDMYGVCMYRTYVDIVPDICSMQQNNGAPTISTWILYMVRRKSQRLQLCLFSAKRLYVRIMPCGPAKGPRHARNTCRQGLMGAMLR